MKNGRALGYGIASAVLFLGICLGAVTFFFDDWDLAMALGMETALILPSACTLIFMGVTETDRKKPWYKAMVEKEKADDFYFEVENVDPVKAARFGVLSGGMWLFAIALFVTIGIFFTWNYAWLVFLFAIGVQVAMAATIFGRTAPT
jgi:hypothetical protein